MSQKIKEIKLKIKYINSPMFCDIFMWVNKNSFKNIEIRLASRYNFHG